MKKIFLGTVVLTALAAASPATAADLPTKAPIYRAPVPVAYSWTGCYIGANVGGLWARKDWNVTNTGTFISSQDVSGWLGGGQIGCNYQMNSWVFGIQADYDWADASGSANDQVFAASDRSRVRALASVTGRIGYTPWERMLFYVKGGGAWERDRYDTTLLATGATFSTASETRPGWTVGFGGEYAFTENLTGFAEYDYYDFGTRTNSFSVIGTSTTQFADIRERKSVVKIGINWKFGNWWTPAPVVTRY